MSLMAEVTLHSMLILFKTVVELKKRKFDITDSIIDKLVEVIAKLLPKKVKIAMPSLYKSWDDYIDAF